MLKIGGLLEFVSGVMGELCLTFLDSMSAPMFLLFLASVLLLVVASINAETKLTRHILQANILWWATTDSFLTFAEPSYTDQSPKIIMIAVDVMQEM